MYNLKLLAVGDISLYTKHNEYPFYAIEDTLREKDILFGNLETVLSISGTAAEKAVLLHMSPDKAVYLKDAGFDVLNVANNHIMDLGAEGFHNTLAALRERNLNFIGVSDKPEADRFVILERHGIRLGFLAYCESVVSLPEKRVWVNEIKASNIFKDIQFIKSKCDFIIVSLHWGIENVFYPSPRQIELARKLIDCGASLILGHHPHVVQGIECISGIEEYKHGLIVYSLGNFQFTPAISYSRTNHSIIVHIEFGTSGIENYYIIPVMIDKNYTPVPMDAYKKEMVDFLDKISNPIINNSITWGWWFEKIAKEYLSGNIKSWKKRIKRYGLYHFLQFSKWLISPFVLRCYVGLLRSHVKQFMERKKW